MSLKALSWQRKIKSSSYLHPMLITYSLSFIFLCIAGIHLYWAFGGQFGKMASVPSNENGEPLFIPGPLPCILVAFVFIAFTLVLHLPEIVVFNLDLLPIVSWIMVAIFAFRIIGDFNYIGLFKKVKQTDFAILDNRFIIPLCALVILLLILRN